MGPYAGVCRTPPPLVQPPVFVLLDAAGGEPSDVAASEGSAEFDTQAPPLRAEALMAAKIAAARAYSKAKKK